MSQHQPSGYDVDLYGRAFSQQLVGEFDCEALDDLARLFRWPVFDLPRRCFGSSPRAGFVHARERKTLRRVVAQCETDGIEKSFRLGQRVNARVILQPQGPALPAAKFLEIEIRPHTHVRRDKRCDAAEPSAIGNKNQTAKRSKRLDSSEGLGCSYEVNQPPVQLRGRGAMHNPANRFEKLAYIADPDFAAGFGEDEQPLARTQFLKDSSRSFITYNDSPDVGFDASINPYRGCEHGCVYCYARPTHEYLGFSSGLDFETKVLVKEDGPEMLREELSSAKWKPQVVAISGVTDAYQPIERRLQLTRRCLEVFLDFRNPVMIVTKNRLVTRDMDLLAELATHNAAAVFLSVTTLDAELARVMEPRTSTPANRLEAIRSLAGAGVPVGVLVAPVIPGLTDHEITSVVKAAADAGAQYASYVVLRLPYANADLFELLRLCLNTAGKLDVQASVFLEHAPVGRDALSSIPQVLFRSLGDYANEDSRRHRARRICLMSFSQPVSNLTLGYELPARDRSDQRVDIQRLRNEHSSLPKSLLHLRRDLDPLRARDSLQFLPPSRARFEFAHPLSPPSYNSKS